MNNEIININPPDNYPICHSLQRSRRRCWMDSNVSRRSAAMEHPKGAIQLALGRGS
ncbi:hypothetical protein [uncultured Porphyromonas sp.]|uniref:hypothetical protein n=1 Tax=uncultured Porphyromonas sp. TaxID=159274 RepID=UPI002629681B|nr:hypothetical protein [uncultured Porphyromonas sp.]